MNKAAEARLIRQIRAEQESTIHFISHAALNDLERVFAKPKPNEAGDDIVWELPEQYREWFMFMRRTARK